MYQDNNAMSIAFLSEKLGIPCEFGERRPAGAEALLILLALLARLKSCPC